ncbi:uncharacterized protein FIBRA_03402 [Fibroporia radiculosa]|uniref:Uncharacterized protein n=1 Tax=Fibroporia radiculosa TaxID=599839 RepID=J4HVZ1_9APHY|nr:uncharacterized protein FIBRA_03402 [Fibroporia radiculosa]CCM01352.1 predicted protein [Fibroporia radiculosa]
MITKEEAEVHPEFVKWFSSPSVQNHIAIVAALLSELEDAIGPLLTGGAHLCNSASCSSALSFVELHTEKQ